MSNSDTRRSWVYHGLVLSAWAAGAIYFAYSRSLWCDEWVRVQGLKEGVFQATRAILAEPSPFNPGEAIPNGLAKIVLTFFHCPMEIWARLQEIGWGVTTLWIALIYSERAGAKGARPYLPVLVAFSAALMSLSTEMRPYASLYFSGALAMEILREKAIKTRALNVLSWALILFGHLYGICFLIFSLVLSGRLFRESRKIVCGIAVVAVVLLKGRIVTAQWHSAMLPLLEFLRQTVGTLTNPHKASLILVPLFFLGLFRLAGKDRVFCVKTLLLLAVTVLGPIAATVSSGYFFVPRQIVAGCFPFLAVAAQGFESLEGELRRIGNGVLSRVVPGALLVACSVLPWTLTTVFRIQPFTDQPFHRFRELAAEVKAHRWKSVLMLDYCNFGSMHAYLDRVEGKPSRPETEIESGGHRLKQVCWESGLCMSSPDDAPGCGVPREAFSPGGSGVRLLASGRYDVILASFIKPFPSVPPGTVYLRTW